MNLSIENTSPLGRRLTVSLENAQLKKNISDKIRELCNTVALKGFRAGKVPAEMIKKKFGPSVHAKALEDVVSKHAFSIIDQEKFQIAGQPLIEKVNELPETIEYTMSFEIYPTIELADLSGLELEQLQVEITEQDIETMIEKLQAKNAPAEALEKEGLVKQMERAVTDAIRFDTQEKVLALLLEKNNVELPSALIQKELLAMQQERSDVEQSEEEKQEIARKRVLLGLLVTEYVSKKELKATPELIQKEIQKIANLYPQVSPEAIVQAYLSDKRLLAGVERMVLLGEVIDTIIKDLKVVEKKQNFHDVIA